MTHRTASRVTALLLACTMAVGAAPTSKPAASGERFVVPKGSIEWATTDVTVHDKARDKDLELRVRVPKGKAPATGWPLVVFSHGAGGSRTTFPDLLDFWASHGYASVAITHSDSIELSMRNRGGAPGDGLRKFNSPDGRRNLRNSVDLPSRTADCSFVLDAVAEISDAVVAKGGSAFKVDPDRLAIAGHSAGAYTTEILVGTEPKVTLPRRRSKPDPRFKVGVVISGVGTAAPALGPDSWSKIEVPILVITGSLDTSPPEMGNETPESRQDPYTHSRGTAAGGPPAYLLFIEGATHSSYGGRAVTALLGDKPTTDVKLIGDSVAACTTLFLDAHLRKDDKARSTIDSAKPADTIPGKSRWEHK